MTIFMKQAPRNRRFQTEENVSAYAISKSLHIGGNAKEMFITKIHP